MSSSWAHHHCPLTKPTTQDYIASSTSIERADQSARAAGRLGKTSVISGPDSDFPRGCKRQLSPAADMPSHRLLPASCQKEKSDGGSLAGACSVLFAASKWLSGRGSSKVLTLGKLGFRSAQLAGER
jgi:hypothetical protein